jgi:Uma2 family endonuclease
MSSPQPDLLTPEEYLAIERKAEIRSEYIQGRMYAMSGASLRHSALVGNILGGIWTQTRGKGCHVHATDLRVKVTPTGLYTYPDVVAFCGEARVEDSHQDTLLNPAVIVEVLSPSTEAYDRGEKFANYRRIDALREYVLVSQDKKRVEHFRRDGDDWRLTEISEPGAALHLEAIGCSLTLLAIYENVDFG